MHLAHPVTCALSPRSSRRLSVASSPPVTGAPLHQTLALEGDTEEMSTVFLSQVFPDSLLLPDAPVAPGSFGTRINPLTPGADIPLRDLLRRLRFVVDLHALPLLTSEMRASVLARVVDRVVGWERLACRTQVRALALRLLDDVVDELRARILKDYKAFQQLLWRVQGHLSDPDIGDPSSNTTPTPPCGPRRRGRGG